MTAGATVLSRPLRTVKKFLLVLPLFGFCHTASAATLVSNLDESPTLDRISVTFLQWLASSFETGASPAQIDSVTYLAGPGPSVADFALTVYTDAGGVPGAPLVGGQLAGPTNPTGDDITGTTIDFSANNLLVDANTRYWLVASSTVFGAGPSWKVTISSDDTSDEGWSVGDSQAFSENRAASWLTDSSGRIGMFAVNGTIVPEPGGTTLLASGAACLLGRRRRQGRS